MITIVYIAWAILHSLATISVSIAIVLICYFVHEKLSLLYWKWQQKKRKQQWQKDYEELLRWRHRRELCRIEREKYPLFFWRELCSKQRKENI